MLWSNGYLRINWSVVAIPVVILITLIVYDNAYSHVLSLDMNANEDVSTRSESSTISQSQALKFTDNQCVKGDPGISDSWMQETFKEFLAVYNKKPGVNKYGSKLAHQFALYAMVKHLQPLHIIESGIYKGLGTWILRQAAPQAQLIMLDPNGGGLTYKDTRKNTVYITEKSFKDFSLVDWKAMNLDFERTLVFLDDHQSGIKRALQARNVGFRHLMFDDNYPIKNGDNYSFKTACTIYFNQTDFSNAQFTDNFGKVKRPLTDKDREVTRFVFDKGVETYFEFPSPWRRQETSRAVFRDFDFPALKKMFSDICRPGYWAEEYVNICYVKLVDGDLHKKENENMLNQLMQKTT